MAGDSGDSTLNSARAINLLVEAGAFCGVGCFGRSGLAGLPVLLTLAWRRLGKLRLEARARSR